MALNLSPFLDKLRIAGPDLIVGIVGIPIAFSFQNVAEKVEHKELLLSKPQLYMILVILILSYLVFALIILDIAHGFDKRNVAVRAAQAILALITIILIVVLGYEPSRLKDLNLYLSICIGLILFLPFPPFHTTLSDDILCLFLSLLAISTGIFIVSPEYHAHLTYSSSIVPFLR